MNCADDWEKSLQGSGSYKLQGEWETELGPSDQEGREEGPVCTKFRR